MTVTTRITGFGLDVGPRLVGALRQADVVGPVIREADDPAVVGGCAVGVAEFEPLQAEHAGAWTRGSPVRRTGTEGAEADHDEVPLASHQARW